MRNQIVERPIDVGKFTDISFEGFAAFSPTKFF